MTIGPYPIEQVISAIASVSGVKSAGVASDLEAACRAPPNATPAVYVLLEERGIPTDALAENLFQRVLAKVKVVVWVRHAGGRSGEEAARLMGRTERAIRKRLFGFVPSGEDDFEPLAIDASGADQAFGDHAIRQLLFVAEYTEVGEPS